MADACSIQDPQGTISFGAPLLGIEWVVGWTAQRSIGLWSKRGTGEAMSKGRSCELRRTIDDRRRGLVH